MVIYLLLAFFFAPFFQINNCLFYLALNLPIVHSNNVNIIKHIYALKHLNTSKNDENELTNIHMYTALQKCSIHILSNEIYLYTYVYYPHGHNIQLSTCTPNKKYPYVHHFTKST